MRAEGHAYSASGVFLGGPNVLTTDTTTLAAGFDISMLATALQPAQVVDAESGRPVEGAELVPLGSLDESKLDPPRAAVTSIFTDAAGRCIFPKEWRAMQYEVRAAVYCAATWFVSSGAVDAEHETRIELERGLQLEVLLEGPGGAVGGVEALLARERQDEYWVRSGAPGVRAGDGNLHRGTSDADGRISFSGLPADRFVVRVSSADWFAQERVELEPHSDPLRLVLRLAPATTIRGRVDPPPRRLPELQVLLWDAERRTRSARVTSDGAFLFERLGSGIHHVALHWGSRPGPFALRKALIEGEPRCRRVELDPGQSHEIILSGPQGGGAIEGELYLNGSPARLQGVELRWNGDESGEGPFQFVSAAPNTTTDGIGRFRFEGLLPGPWSVRVPGESRCTLARVEVEVGPNAVARADLQARSATLVVEARECETGERVGGYSIRLKPDPSFAPALRPARQASGVEHVPTSGQLRLEPLTPGHYLVELLNGGEADQAVELLPGSETELVLAVGPR